MDSPYLHLSHETRAGSIRSAKDHVLNYLTEVSGVRDLSHREYIGEEFKMCSSLPGEVLPMHTLYHLSQHFLDLLNEWSYHTSQLFQGGLGEGEREREGGREGRRGKGEGREGLTV